MPNRDPKYRTAKTSADFDRQDVDLIEKILMGADLRGLNLTGANLQKADLEKADLHGLNLAEANLRMANLRGANLSDANLTNTILRGANLNQANLTNVNLRMANLQEANLDGANLLQANLTNTRLLRANLHHANLTSANLQKANLEAAKLTGANLDGADLKGSINGHFKDALNVPGYDIPCIAYQRQGLGHSRNESCKWCTVGIMTPEQRKAYNEAFEEWKKANPTVEATINPITLTNSDPEYGEVGRNVNSVAATCSKCAHKTESFGHEQKSILRCLTVLREECPRNETNFYVSDEELTELWEQEMGARIN